MDNPVFKWVRHIVAVVSLFIIIFVHEGEEGRALWITVLKGVCSALVGIVIWLDVVLAALNLRRKNEKTLQQMYDGEIGIIGISFVGKHFDSPKNGQFCVTEFCTYDIKVARGFYEGDDAEIEKAKEFVIGHAYASLSQLSQIAGKTLFLERVFYENTKDMGHYSMLYRQNTVETYVE